jgi:hypothetical protein
VWPALTNFLPGNHRPVGKRDTAGHAEKNNNKKTRSPHGGYFSTVLAHSFKMLG